MNASRLIDLLLAQRRDGFAALSGTRVDAALVLDDRLLNDLIATSLPAGAPIADLAAHALPGGRIRLGFRVPRVSILPRLNLTLVVVSQPVLPDRPVLDLRLEGAGGLMALAGPALRFLDALPPGIRIAGSVVQIDLQRLLTDRNLGDLLPLLDRLEIDTEDARVHVNIRVRVP